MNEALRLSPAEVAYYVNRALIKYHMEDLRGAMADYDHVLEIQPHNLITRYNRGLLRMQVGDRNRAITDFSEVIKAEPENYFAYYNRAVLNDELGNYRAAIKDYDVVLKEYPDFAAGFYARSEAKRKSGDMKGGEQDFNKALALQKTTQYTPVSADGKTDNKKSGDNSERKESDKNINKFDRILVADAENDIKPKYDNRMRGRVQDQNIQITIEPSFILTYYEKTREVGHGVAYSREVDDINRSKLLARQLLLTNAELSLSTAQINNHFSSINDYSKLIDINSQNPMPYFARALDFMLIQDFSSAIDDLNRTIMLSRNFMLAYFMRAAIRFKQIEYKISTESANGIDLLPSQQERGTFGLRAHKIDTPLKTGSKDESLSLEYEMVLRDYEKVLEMSPGFVYGWFNRANVRCAQKDFRGAILDYNEAIRLRPDFGEAYFNRGLVYLKQGNEKEGIADLSKAGELGIVGAYNILKRLSD